MLLQMALSLSFLWPTYKTNSLFVFSCFRSYIKISELLRKYCGHITDLQHSKTITVWLWNGCGFFGAGECAQAPSQIY